MCTVYNRKYKQSIDSLLEKFPSSKLLIRLDGDDEDATEGYLISVSTSPEDQADFRPEMSDSDCEYFICGFMRMEVF